MLTRLSAWYDSLNEPKRFFTFLALVFGWYLPFTAYVLLDSVGFNFYLVNVLLTALGVCHLIFFYTFAIFRATRK